MSIGNRKTSLVYFIIRPQGGALHTKLCLVYFSDPVDASHHGQTELNKKSVTMRHSTVLNLTQHVSKFYQIEMK